MNTKKHLLTLSALVMILCTISCKKDSDTKEFCVACTIKTSQTITDIEPIIGETTMEYCGITNMSLDAMLKSGNMTTTATSGGITVTIKTETICNKK